MSDFTFELASSATLAKIGELTQARDRQLHLVLNKAGAFSMRLPLTDAIAMKVQEVSTCVIVKRLGTYVWSGPVWTTSESTPDLLNVDCVGWLQTLEKRVTKPAWGSPLQYVGIDAADISYDLLARSNGDNSFGLNYVIPGVRETTQARTRVVSAFSGVLGEITNLSELEAGYDMLVDPRTRMLNMYNELGSIKSQALFEYGGAATSVSRNCDVSRLCNRMIAYSAAGYAQADDIVSQQTYGLFEEAVSLSDVKDITILQAYANGEIAVRSTPLRFHNFGPRPYSSANPSDPRIFEDFNVADIVYLKVDRGRLEIPKQAVRIFGATIGFDDDTGRERLSSLQTTATS